MIEPTSLRLGNLAMYGVHIVPIRSIHVTDEDAWVYIELNGKLKNYCVDISEIEPIPLTEELLLRFGFVRNKAWFMKDGFQLGYITDDKCFQFEYQTPFIEWDIIDVIHVHQLQNLFYIIKNQELKLEGL
jgi:hypothetical protein